jgi:hypothetical protein
MLRKRKYFHQDMKRQIPVAARSKAWGCGRSLSGITCSNPAVGVDLSLSLSVNVVSSR